MKAPLKKKRKMCYSFSPFFEQLAGFSASKVNAVREIFTGQGQEAAVEFSYTRLVHFFASSTLSFGGSFVHYELSVEWQYRLVFLLSSLSGLSEVLHLQEFCLGCLLPLAYF